MRGERGEVMKIMCLEHKNAVPSRKSASHIAKKQKRFPVKEQGGLIAKRSVPFFFLGGRIFVKKRQFRV